MRRAYKLKKKVCLEYNNTDLKAEMEDSFSLEYFRVLQSPFP